MLKRNAVIRRCAALAAALSASALSVTALAAEPSPNTVLYQIGPVGPDSYGYAAISTRQRTGDQASIWSFTTWTATPKRIDGHDAIGSWIRFTFDCKASTRVLAEIAMLETGPKTFYRISEPGPAAPVEQRSATGQLFGYACAEIPEWRSGPLPGVAAAVADAAKNAVK